MAFLCKTGKFLRSDLLDAMHRGIFFTKCLSIKWILCSIVILINDFMKCSWPVYKEYSVQEVFHRPSRETTPIVPYDSDENGRDSDDNVEDEDDDGDDDDGDDDDREDGDGEDDDGEDDDGEDDESEDDSYERYISRF